MMDSTRRAWLATLLLFTGCATISPAKRAQQEHDAAPALEALQAANFEQALSLSARAVESDPSNARAHAIDALARLVTLNRALAADLMTLGASMALAGALRSNFIDLELFDTAFDRADTHLSQVQRALEQASADEGVSLELCLACWDVDWNRNGTVDDFDRHLFELEREADGTAIPEGDPRRRPTFRFDLADLHWLRALAAFERGTLELARAWDWSPLVRLAAGSTKGESVRLPVRSAERARHAHALFLEGLHESRACRAAALAERDDDREWVPNPLQRSHPVPLEVDLALYQTWASTLDELEALLRSERGLDLAELATGLRESRPLEVHGFIDLGRWLSMPEDLTLDLRADRLPPDRVLQDFFGSAYVKSMTPSGLGKQLLRLQSEVHQQRSVFEQKLRYLLWFN